MFDSSDLPKSLLSKSHPSGSGQAGSHLPEHNSPLPFHRAPLTLHHAAVIGAGAWGTALASALQRAGVSTTLWARRSDTVAHLDATRRAEALPDHVLPPALQVTDDLATAVRGAQLVILAVPAVATRDLARRLRDRLDARTLVLSASKGFEHESGAFMTQVLDEALGQNRLTGVLTGPSFAAGVARSEPTLLTLAMAALAPSHPQHRLALRYADALTLTLPRVAIQVETTSDVIGAQVGGALKNQIAIACGMAMALGMGENARAGILTRGLEDMRRLILALGGRPETLLGSCGVGDLFLTAASRQSRNTRLGMRLASGQSASRIDRNELTEGAYSAHAVSLLEQQYGLHLALSSAVRDVLDGVRAPAQALTDLLESQAAPLPLSRSGTLAEPPPASATPLPALLRRLEQIHDRANARALRHA